jgi:2-polyprenyl-6-methoxyphenol hydroxylase-like FAD-dependent oxidoreductase
LERSLAALVNRLENVTERRGLECVAVNERDDLVEVEVKPWDEKIQSSDGAGTSETIRAHYLVGADGARSTVRTRLGVEFEDFGFSERWFVVDVRPRNRGVADRLAAIPTQYCQPERPHMQCPNGAHLHRWEFMLLPGEEASDFEDPARIGELLAPWIAPDEAEVVRGTVYEFRAAVAETLRAGRRSFLAGDAGHLMPPHMGEGMCSGLRDAKNLAWRLDLALRQLAGDGVLESYSAERLPHARDLVERSLTMGRISCERDPALAAARDSRLRATGAVESWPFPRLGRGLEYARSAAAELVGHVSVQGVVEVDGQRGRLDDVIGHGFQLVARGAPKLSAHTADAFDRIGGQVVTLGGSAADVDGQLSGWLTRNGIRAVLVRPDFYVFGAVVELEDTEELVCALLTQLGASQPATLANN